MSFSIVLCLVYATSNSCVGLAQLFIYFRESMLPHQTIFCRQLLSDQNLVR